jgi:hypothetical protein
MLCWCVDAGMVPALYDDGEKEGLISSFRAELSQASLPDSKEACWAAFVDKVRSNLHVVLAMSPVGDALRSRCRNFPGLVNNTVIDWFEPWPEQVGPTESVWAHESCVVQAQACYNPCMLLQILPASCCQPHGRLHPCSTHAGLHSMHCGFGALTSCCHATRRRCKAWQPPSWQTRSFHPSCDQPSCST